MSESLLSRSNLVSKLLRNKKFRDRYVYEHVRNGIPFQIRALRNQRAWTQADLGEATGKPRPVISRLEDPNYGKLSLKTLFEIASAFEVALLVKFVPFSRLVREYEDVSWQALTAKPVAEAEEITKLESWAKETVAQTSTASRVLQIDAGTEKTARMLHSCSEHWPLTLSIADRQDYVRSPFFRRGEETKPARMMDTKDTGQAA